MATVEDIESAADQLPREQLFELVDRLRVKYAEAWDRQIEEDARPGGPLDRLAEKAISEYHAGKTRPLP